MQNAKNVSRGADQNFLGNNLFQQATTPTSLQIRKITRQDENVFYNHLLQYKPNSAAFEDQWPYILQATRDEGYVVKSGENLLYCWNRGAQLIVVNRIGPDTNKTTLTPLVTSMAAGGVSTLVKNVDDSDIEYLKEAGFKVPRNPWSKFSLQDDNSFPLIIADACGIASRVRGALKKDFIRTLKKFERTTSISAELVPMFDISVRTLLSEQAKYLAQKGVDEEREVLNAHEFMFKDITKCYRFEHRNIESRDELIGASQFTVVGPVIFANAIVVPPVRNLMGYLLWQGINATLMHCQQLGLQQPSCLSLQGSENSGQYRWKLNFRPIQLMERTHMEFPALHEKS